MSSSPDPLDIAQQFIDKNKDSFGQIGFGGAMGYCSGMAFRRVGKFMGLVIGVGEYFANSSHYKKMECIIVKTDNYI